MREIYEIVYRTRDGYRGNVLFSSRENAESFLQTHYRVGTVYSDNDVIVLSFIVERILF